MLPVFSSLDRHDLPSEPEKMHKMEWTIRPILLVAFFLTFGKLVPFVELNFPTCNEAGLIIPIIPEIKWDDEYNILGDL